MDPLTHTLVGANLASTRLGARSRLAAAALVIGANLPDVDSILYFTGHSDLALGFRRGITHGVLALIVLPFVQTALLMLYAKVEDRHSCLSKAGNGTGRSACPPLDAKWLLFASAIGIATHPALDWLNNYGMRWLMPFRGTWSYGDSVYIMDPWLWLLLGGGWLAGKRATPAMLITFGVFTALLAWVVGNRSTQYLPVVAIVAVILLGALLWRAPRSLSATALVLAMLYIGARLAIHAYVASDVRDELRADRLMAAPHPIDPLRWDVVAQTGDVYRYGRWQRGALTLAPDRLPVAKDSPEWRIAKDEPSIRGFMTWVRFPWYEVERRAEDTRVLVHDARYAVRRRPGGGFGGVEVVIPNRPPRTSP